jgi:hypothetical protein
MSFRRRPSSIVLAALLAVAPACGTSFVPMRPTEPAAVRAGGLLVEAQRILLTDDALTDGMGDETALVVELAVTNAGPGPASFGAASVSCLMALDPNRPTDTRGLVPVAGGEGPFPGEIPGGLLLRPLALPSGGRGVYWIMFRGYRYPGSDLARRITLRVPGPGGHPVELVLADPAHGAQRWAVDPVRSTWSLGFQNTTLFGSYLTGMAASTQLAREARLGRLVWSVGVNTSLLIQLKGKLISPVSSFQVSGLAARLMAPLLGWGAAPQERQLGVYVGAGGRVLLELRPPGAADSSTPPHVYGAGIIEAGLELATGTLRFAASPFPLSAASRPLPRWSVQLGYTHWWIGHGSADGYNTSFRLAW